MVFINNVLIEEVQTDDYWKLRSTDKPKTP